MLIGIMGAKGHGKGILAEYLKLHSFEVIKFATPLKDMLRALGLGEDEIEGHLKEVPCDRLVGRTPRHAMVTLGTEWGRDMISPNLWVSAWKRQARAAMMCEQDVVVDDVRFRNEVEAVQAMGGKLIRVVRPSVPIDASHPSEAQTLEVVRNGIYGLHTIINDGSIADLHAAFSQWLQETKRDSR